jgi:hypothetical protein
MGYVKVQLQILLVHDWRLFASNFVEGHGCTEIQNPDYGTDVRNGWIRTWLRL